MSDHYPLGVAEYAARVAIEAGAFLVARQGSAIRFRTKKDFVADVDGASDRLIRGLLGREYPQISFLTEEGDSSEIPEGDFWVIDPVDGTLGYFLGSYDYAISIALVSGGVVVAGVIYQPALGLLYTATNRSPSIRRKVDGKIFLPYNDPAVQRACTIKVQDHADLTRTQFMFDWGKDTPDRFAHTRLLRILDRLDEVTLYPQTTSSAAITALTVAWGRSGGCIFPKIEPWDVAAAALIIRQAGGRVTDFKGEPWTLTSPEFLASNGQFHSVLLDIAQSV